MKTYAIALNEHGQKMNPAFVFEQALKAIEHLQGSIQDHEGETFDIRMNEEVVGVEGFKIGVVSL